VKFDKYESIKDLSNDIKHNIANEINSILIDAWGIFPKDFIKKHLTDFEKVCTFISIADKYFYNERANTFKNHPLGIQINLDTGVANGVLVVRTIDTCAKLLYNIFHRLVHLVYKLWIGKIWIYWRLGRRQGSI